MADEHSHRLHARRQTIDGRFKDGSTRAKSTSQAASTSASKGLWRREPARARARLHEHEQEQGRTRRGADWEPQSAPAKAEA
jgi:hypothetical protein